MKRIIKLMIVFMVFIPFIVSAEVRKLPYSGSVELANNYINGYSTKDRYLILGSKIFGSDFGTNGGFITADEFRASLIGNSSYLSGGLEYWTQTSAGSNKYIISFGLVEKDPSEGHGTRVVEYVRPETKIRGNGSIHTPWEFVEQYRVEIITNRNDVSISPSETNAIRGTSPKFDITETKGVMYSGVDDCGLVRTDKAPEGYKKQFEIPNISRDVTCTANFATRKIKISYNCGDGSGSTQSQTITFGTSYTLNTSGCTRSGYRQVGWKTSTGDRFNFDASGKISGTWNIDEGEKGVVNNQLALTAVWEDIQSPIITIKAVDNNNSSTTLQNVQTFNTNNLSGNIYNVKGGNWFNTNVKFEITLSDNEGVTSVQRRYNTSGQKDGSTTLDNYGSWNNATINNGKTGITNQNTVTGDGYRKIQYQFSDAAGNKTSFTVIVKLDKVAPTCKLKINGSNVVFDTKSDNNKYTLDNTVSYGMSNSNSATYNSASSIGLGVKTYYGFVKDAAGNTGSCSLDVKNTVASKWTKKSEKCINYYSSITGNYTQSNSCNLNTCGTSGCSCGGYTASGTYYTTYNATASYSGTINCSKTTYSCSRGSLISGAWKCQIGATSKTTYSGTCTCNGWASQGTLRYSGTSNTTCYQYCKNNGYTRGGTGKITSNTTHSCPSGFSGPSGGYCYKNATSSTSTSNVSCNTAAKYNNPGGQCSSGYSYTGNSCSRSYSCPNGGSRSGTTCSVAHSCTTGTCGSSGCSCYYTTASGSYNTYPSCTSSTCNKSGCNCVTSYKFDTASTATNQTSCTNNSFTCNASTNGQTKVTCTETEWSCAQSGYTKLNNTFCYK